MNTEANSSYEDIISLPHHVSKRHPQMPLTARAAQFSPFAALTGHEDAIRETGRMTEGFRELDEDERDILDYKIRFLQERLSECPEVEVTYFQPDLKKNGGAYVTVRGKVEKIDVHSCRMLFTDQTAIAMQNICTLDGEMFKEDGEPEYRSQQ